MITANFIHRTFRIRCGRSIGTAFTIDVNARQYLVTAHHVVHAFESIKGIEYFGYGAWNAVAAELVGHGNGGIDVSVLAMEKLLTPPGLPVLASSEGLTYGQDMYFLGFPYDILGNVVFDTEGFHLPFVKRATMSCFAGDMYFLDGHNNPGFSGGPVLFGPIGKTPTNIAGIISGYKAVPEPVFDQDRSTEFIVKQNTGIIVTYKIEKALELIQEKPIGVKLHS